MSMTDELDDFKSALVQSIASFAVEGLTDAQIDQLAEHYRMLRLWNRRVNLTRIIDPVKRRGFTTPNRFSAGVSPAARGRSLTSEAAQASRPFRSPYYGLIRR